MALEISSPQPLDNMDRAGASKSKPIRSRWQRALRATAFGIIGILSILWYVGVFGGNLHEVLPGELYRSAQLTGSNLRSALEKDHIRTVINLRGPETGDPWWKNETAVCRGMGVGHVDVAFSASHLPPPKELSRLMAALDNSPRPVLLHCMGGSDRTGLAATLYLTLYKHVPLDQAEEEELTLRYGHIKWGSARAMDQFFDLYRQTAGGLALRNWIRSYYPSLYQRRPM